MTTTTIQPTHSRRRARRITVLAVLLGAVIPSAHADLPVIDFTNLAQTTLTAGRALQQINNQVLQLQNEAVMLINEARNLTSLPFSILSQLQQTLSTTTQLINQATGIAYQVQQAQSVFSTLYPFGYASTVSGVSMSFDAFQRWAQSLTALQTTISMQAQAATNLNADANYLSSLVSQSQGAVGILQATQATNQLLALQSRQTIQAQQLQITNDRSAALEIARTVAAESRAREVRRRFEGDGTPYTPQPINFYGF